MEGLGIRLAFRLDGLSLLFALLVTGIGALVLVYAGSYFKDDEQSEMKLEPVILDLLNSVFGDGP